MIKIKSVTIINNGLIGDNISLEIKVTTKKGTVHCYPFKIPLRDVGFTLSFNFIDTIKD
jgi:hypothetical protein